MKAQKTLFYLVFSLFLLGAGNVQAQRNLEKGKRFFDLNQYEKAIPFFEKDMKSSDRQVKVEAMALLADCYRLLGDFENAEKIYKKLIKKSGKKDGYKYLYKYGEALKAAAKYAEAKKVFVKYSKKNPDDPRGPKMAMSCDFAQEMLDADATYDVRELKLINTKDADISPVYYKNGIVFSAQRPGGKKPFVSFDGGAGEVLLDLYYMDFSGSNKSLDNKTYFFPGLNTNNHEGPATFSTDGKEVFFTTTVEGKRLNASDDVVQHTLQIYTSKLQGDTMWTTPKSAFTFNSSKYSVFHPSLSADGKKLFFASNKEGGFGGVDIYVTYRNKAGEWSEPYNLGPQVNTTENELFPFYDNKGKVYFSSNGHPGMGKLDIFSAEFDPFKGWVNTQNLRVPVNSIGDDICYVESGSSGKGLFVSNRINGTGSDDIYAFSKIQPIEIQLDHEHIWIKDNSAYDALTFKFKKKGQKKSKLIDIKNGYYTFKPELDTTYIVAARKDGFSYNKFNLTVSKNEDGNRVVHIKPKKGDVEFRLYAGEAKTYNDTIADSLLVEPHKEGFFARIARKLRGESTATYSLKQLVDQEVIDIHSNMEIQEGIYVKHSINNSIQGKRMTGKDGSVSFIASNNKKNKFTIISHPESEDEQEIVYEEIKVEELKEEDLKKSRKKVKLLGTVSSKDGSVAGALVEAYLGDSVIAKTQTSKDGMYQLLLKEETAYTVSVTKSGFFQYNQAVSTKAFKQSKGKESQDFILAPIVENKAISIPNIYYKSGSWKLSKKSIVELERLVVFMKENPQIKALEIYSHTDNVGNDRFNLELSQKRAASVKRFLEQAGVPADKLQAIGKGETELLIKDAQDDLDHAKNRRTEFKVVLK